MRVYLAGPIFAKATDECSGWRERIKAAPGYEWADPMDRDMRGLEDDAYAKIVEGDKDDIDESDAIIADVRLGPSHGTSMEILWGWLGRKHVVAIAKAPYSPWLRYHATKIVATEDEAVAALGECVSS